MENFEKIDEKIFVLKGTRSCNIYYFDFNKKALIDTGHPFDFDSNFKIFKQNNVPLDKIDYIINTHSHCDHIGGNLKLKKLNPGIKIIGSKNSNKFQDLRNRLLFLKEIEDDHDRYDIDIFTNEKDKIDLGGCVLETIENPGHTIDSLSFYIKDKRFLFSGDIIYSGVITQLDYYQDIQKSLTEIIDSYKKIKELNLLCFYTGHGQPIFKTNENLNICLKKLDRFKKDHEMVIINNLIPSIEHYIHKMVQINLTELKDFFFKVFKISIEKKFINIDENKFETVFNKAISLMLLLNIIKKDDSGFLYLVSHINQYIGIKKIK